MRKFTAYIVLVLCILIYAVSLNDDLTRDFTAYKIQAHPIVKSDKYRYGDLYGMSYFSKLRSSIYEGKLKATNCNQPKKMDLYAICDSYLWSFINSSNYYCGVDKFSYSRTNNREPLHVKLDSSKINILLIELSERNVRTVLEDSVYVETVLQLQKDIKESSVSTDSNGSLKKNNKNDDLPKSSTFGSLLKSARDLKAKIFDILFNKKIDTNIESNVWDISIFTPVKELKAFINYKLFNTLNKDVKLSKKKDQLFLNLTIDTSHQLTSSFSYIPQQELSTLISRLNTLYSRALRLGFNKVYLSIIPNPVSILEPDYAGLQYNDMINRIQGSPDLQMPSINLIPDYKKLRNSAYFKSDSHWNINGAQVWLNKFNIELEKTIRENQLAAKK